MADENPPVRGKAAEKFAAAAERAAAAAQSAEATAGKVEKAGRDVDSAAKRVERAASNAARRRPGVAQYDEPIGPSAQRFFSEQKSRLSEISRAAQEERQLRLRELNKTEGSLKAAETRLRKQRGDAYGAIRPFGEGEAKQRAAIERAEAKRDTAKGAYESSVEGANRAAIAERDFRGAVRDRRNAQAEAAKTEALAGRQAEAMRIVRTEGGRYQVHGPNRAGGYSGYARPDDLRTRTFKSEEAAERERQIIAQERAARGLEVIEPKKTKAVEEGTKKRTKASKDEVASTRADTGEFERLAQTRAEEAKRELAEHEAYQRRAAAGKAPKVGSAEFKRQQAQERAAAEAIEQKRIGTPVEPTPTAPATRKGKELSAEEEAAAADVRVARDQRRRDADKAARARARQAKAQEASVRAAEEEARRAPEAARLHGGLNQLLQQRQAEETRLAASRPGTDLIRHPTEFGRRVPGPFGGQAGLDAIAAAGADPNYVGRGTSIIPDRSPYFKRQRVAGTAERRDARQDARDAADYERKAAAVQKETDELADLQKAQQAAAASSDDFARATQRTAITADLASNRFRKNGALTTEFIEAARKGQVTMRELGYQVTATIGKFAGWTAAATAVYAVAGAMAQLGKGAIDSEGGVQKVSRVITDIGPPGSANRDRAREGFRALSEKFNVPISDAVDATYGSGKIFGTLSASLQGAESALFAFKVGELDTASATESLNAIVKGFHLQANQLPGVFDAINNVTNRFGGNVGKLTQGVGRAGGLFAAAGGSPEELIALLSSGAQLTGVPATEVATAVGRSVSTVRTKQGAARARAAGLDPTLDPLSLFQQAGQLAKGQSPQRVQEIVRSIIPAGGQFSRIITPLILDMDRLNKTLAATSPAERQGSAQRELAKVMKEPTEQVAQLGNGLQRLGAAGAQAGFLTPFIALLKTLNLTLGLATRLFDLFNRAVPNFLQPILATALELYGVLRLVRRFDIGGQLKGGERSQALRQFLGASPAQRETKQITSGLDATGRYLAGARERAGVEAARAEFTRQQSAKRLAAADPNDAKQLGRLNLQHEKAAERASNLAEEEEDLRTQINQHDERRNKFMRGIKDQGLSPAESARQADIYYRTESFDRPTTQGPVPIGPMTRAEAEAAAAASGAAGPTSRFARATRGLSSSTGRFGLAATGVAGAGKGLASAAKAGVQAATAAGRGMAGAARGLFAMLGPLDLALIGLFAGMAAIDAITKSMDKARKRREELTKPTSDPDAMLREAKKYDRDEVQGAGIRGGGARPDTADERAARIAKEEAEQLRYQQSHGRALGAADIETGLTDDLKTAPTRAARRGLIRTAIKQLNQSFEVVYEGGSDAAKAAQQKAKDLVQMLADLGASGQEISKALSLLDSAGLAAFTEEQGAALALAGRKGRGKRLENIGLTVIRAAQLRGEGGTAADYLKSLQEEEQVVISDAEDRLKRALSVARSPADRRHARQAYTRELTRGLGADDSQLELDRLDVDNRRARFNLRRLRRERRQLPAAQNVDPLTGAAIGGLPADDPDRDKNLSDTRSLKERKATNRRNAAALRAAQRRRRQIINDLKREQAEDAKNEREALFDSRTQLEAGRQSAGAPRLAYEIRRAGQVVQARIRRHGRNSVEALDAIREQESLMSQQVQDQANLITARAEYRAAGATTDAGSDAALTKGLHDRLRFQLARPKDFGEEENLGVMKQIRDANKQRREREQQDALDLINARYEYLRSLTDNPVKLAKLDEQEANRVLARGGFKNQAERYRALADRNNKRRARVNAVNDRRIENLDYEHDIGKLTDDAYIRALKRIESTMKVGSEARRNLRQKIGRLQHDANQEDQFNVNVGDIKLPTIYEIRRAVAGSRGGATVVQNNAVTLHAHGVNDPKALMAQVDNHLTRGGKSAVRAAGLR